MAEVKKPCPWGCDGSGRLRHDEGTVIYCTCFQVRRMRPLLQDFSNAAAITQSPLYIGEGDKLVDRTRENLFIKGYWAEDLRSHFRFALSSKLYDSDFRFRFKTIMDAELLDVWLDKKSYKAQSREDREQRKTFNTLDQFVGPDLDLVLLRLGFLGHPNRAMAGVIKQTLMMRETARKATWLVEDTSRTTFGPGNYSYSEDLAGYIAEQFKIVNLTRKAPPQVILPPHGYDVSGDTDDSEDASLGGDTDFEAAFKRRPKEVFKAPPEPEGNVFASVGALSDKDKKKWRRGQH